MVRTPGFHPGNRGFESRRDHHEFIFRKKTREGSFFNDVYFLTHCVACGLPFFSLVGAVYNGREIK